MKIPVLGKSLESLALSRLTWSLALSLDSGMDARRAVELSIRAAQNPYYESSLPAVTGGIRANKQFHESFREAGVFPAGLSSISSKRPNWPARRPNRSSAWPRNTKTGPARRSACSRPSPRSW